MSYEIPKYKINEWNTDDSTIPKWPDHLQGCDEFNKAIHDHLCEILEAQGYSESDVCMASVGMWGAINVTRDYFENQSALTVNALKANESRWFNEHQKVLDVKNKLVGQLAANEAEIETLKANALPENYMKLEHTIADQSALLQKCYRILKLAGYDDQCGLVEKLKAATSSGEGEK